MPGGSSTAVPRTCAAAAGSPSAAGGAGAAHGGMGVCQLWVGVHSFCLSPSTSWHTVSGPGLKPFRVTRQGFTDVCSGCCFPSCCPACSSHWGRGERALCGFIQVDGDGSCLPPGSHRSAGGGLGKFHSWDAGHAAVCIRELRFDSLRFGRWSSARDFSLTSGDSLGFRHHRAAGLSLLRRVDLSVTRLSGSWVRAVWSRLPPCASAATSANFWCRYCRRARFRLRYSLIFMTYCAGLSPSTPLVRHWWLDAGHCGAAGLHVGYVRFMSGVQRCAWLLWTVKPGRPDTSFQRGGTWRCRMFALNIFKLAASLHQGILGGTLRLFSSASGSATSRGSGLCGRKEELMMKRLQPCVHPHHKPFWLLGGVQIDTEISLHLIPKDVLGTTFR